jgi:ferredoxin-NADP reductase
MPIYNLKLISNREIAQNTMEFIFEKPAGFTFKPGQYGGFTLINPPETDANGITRRFSLRSAPHDDQLAITMRIQQSAYKRVLKNQIPGSEIKFAGPTGNFTLHEDTTTPAVFIAGGIGITPFYSMIRDAAHRQSKQHITLFYGNQSPNDAAYLSELQEIEKNYPYFKLIATMANPDPSWLGETGFITYALIKKYINNLSEQIYYVCGSPAMVSALQETLDELGIAKEKTKIEDFPGY